MPTVIWYNTTSPAEACNHYPSETEPATLQSMVVQLSFFTIFSCGISTIEILM